MGGNRWKDEKYLALLPLPAVLLFVVLLLLNDRQYLTVNQQLIGATLTLIICGGVYALLRALLRRSPTLKRLLQEHGPYVLFLFLLILMKFHATVSGHFFRFNDPLSISDFLFMEYSVKEYHQLPLWNIYIWSGSPSHAIADKWHYYPLVWPFIFLPTVLGLNLLLITAAALGGILMYGLVVHLSKSRQAGLVSALVFVFSAWFMAKSNWLFLLQIFPVELIPAVFFSIFMLTEQTRFSGFLKWGAATGILMGFQLLSGTPEYFIFSSYFVVGSYFAVSLLTSQRLRRALPSLVIAGIIIVVLCSCISAVKELPSLKFTKMTNRGGEWAGQIWPNLPKGTNPLHIFRFLTRSSWTQLGAFDEETNIYTNEEVGELGLIGFLLALAALSKIKKRYVFCLVLISIIAVVMLYLPFFNLLRSTLPLLNRFHMQSRALLLFVFAGAALSGIGWTVVSNKIPKEWLTRAFTLLIALMILDLIILGFPFNKTTPLIDTLKENHILTSLSEREDLFRIASFDVPGIDWCLQPVTVPLEIQYNQGLDGLIWINDYMEYLSIAHNDRSRFWGMLNIKYATSKELVDEPGFVLEQTFEECPICDYPDMTDDHFDGPYLYLNNDTLPRAYTLDNAILVTGDWDTAKNVVYPLLAHQAFDPKTTVVIHDSRSLSNVPRDELSAYKAIVPISELSNSDLDTLRDMKNAGVRIIPDLFAGEKQITQGQIEAVFQELSENATLAQEVEIPLYTPNKVTVGPVGTGKFLVLAEKYSLFPGDWKASAGKASLEMLRANAVGTAIPVASIGGETVTFRYLPPLFVMGAILSTIGLLVGIALIWQPWNKSLSRKKENKEKKGAA